MTSNIVKSLNSILRHAHKLLTTTLVEFVCEIMQHWFYDRKNAIERLETMLTKWASECVTKNLDIVQYMIMKSVDNFIYQVKDRIKDRIANLHKRMCTCRKFNVDFLHCVYVCMCCYKVIILMNLL